jgi:Rhs element Vgr protein
MPTSPYKVADETAGFEITLNGSALQDSVEVLSIETDVQINRVGTARLVLLLNVGDGDDNTFELSEKDDFSPGATIEIKAGLDDKKTIFKGLVVQQGIRNLTGQQNELVLRCSEKSVKMTQGRKSAYFDNMADSAVVSQITGDYGLSTQADATDVTHVKLVQYQATDWDFILSRAEANGRLVYLDTDEKLHFAKPLASGTPVLQVNFSDDVFNFDLSLESRYQLPDAACSAWDPASQQEIKGQSTEPSLSGQGDLTGKDMADNIGFGSGAFTSSAPLPNDATVMKSRLAALQGNITFFGTSLPVLNSLIEVAGFGARFNNNGLVTGVRHQIREGTWLTTVQLGLPPQWHYEMYPIHQPPAGGLLPAISGLQLGTVKKIDADPDGAFRIQVALAGVDYTNSVVWARLSQFYATNAKGSFFLPEVNDEVVLGFLNDDPRFPVILGSLYSTQHAGPYTPDAANKIKAIVTKNDLKIEFDDTDKIITIQTPAGNQLVFSDKGKSIVVQDQNSNKIEMSSSGISLTSPKDIQIKATGKISLEATTGITAKASGGDVGLEGLNVNAKAQIAFSAQGTATAELKSTGNTTVKGGIVMIN